MSDMPQKLRDLKEYADHHRIFDLGLLLRAADHIERLEAQAEETRKYFDEQEARYGR